MPRSLPLDDALEHQHLRPKHMGESATPPSSPETAVSLSSKPPGSFDKDGPFTLQSTVKRYFIQEIWDKSHANPTWI